MRSKTESTTVERVRLRASDGQTLDAVRLSRRSRPPTSEAKQPLPSMEEGFGAGTSPVVLRVGVKVSVVHLDRMRRFYEELVGMSPTRVGGTFVTLNDILALSTSEDTEMSTPSRVSIYLDVLNIQVLWRRIEDNGISVVDPLDGEMGRRRFRCLDPEGNLLEVRETIG